MKSWRSIPVSSKELSLATVLRCGQSFRWKQSRDEVWSLALEDRVLFVKHDTRSSRLLYKSVPDLADTENIVEDYFNLKIKLGQLYREWSEKDDHFQGLAGAYEGVRILRQEPWENLCSFICSSNNNIKRISQMVENLCVYYGTYHGEIEGFPYYSFPTPESLSKPDTESRLRALGFGYRAKYIYKTARAICEHPQNVQYLYSLREKPYDEAHQALVQFAGVGPKVADCVCLMSLDKHDCVPVDTHVWQIAVRDYKLRKHKTMTRAAYLAVQDLFVRQWGSYAGWAHTVLFAADLRDLNNGINQDGSTSPSPILPARKRSLATLDEPMTKVVVM